MLLVDDNTADAGRRPAGMRPERRISSSNTGRCDNAENWNIYWKHNVRYLCRLVQVEFLKAEAQLSLRVTSLSYKITLFHEY